MKDLQELQNRFIELAIAWGEAFTIGDHRKANKHNRAITKLAEDFRADRSLSEAILIPLFTHSDPSVQLFASIHALEQSIQTQEAESTLLQIADNPNIRLIPIMAQINLSNWNKKKNSKKNAN